MSQVNRKRLAPASIVYTTHRHACDTTTVTTHESTYENCKPFKDSSTIRVSRSAVEVRKVSPMLPSDQDIQVENFEVRFHKMNNNLTIIDTLITSILSES